MKKAFLSLILVIDAILWWNGCTFPSSGYTADPAIPTNVTAVAGDSSAVVFWDLQFPEQLPPEVIVRVQYSTSGGPGEQCTRYEPMTGCSVGCEIAGVPGVTQCTVNGLTPGIHYVFTVIAKTSPLDRTEGADGVAYARSDSVIIGTN